MGNDRVKVTMKRLKRVEFIGLLHTIITVINIAAGIEKAPVNIANTGRIAGKKNLVRLRIYFLTGQITLLRFRFIQTM